ncbi:tetratricopeptide repeat protein [Kineococcus aurantiacus]|uniref:Tetratricopeptide (TPR) repeat protein n=1 Tax=Kineococcus aurantiacus TaxID=37633 RepID=A0A7Y9DL99_9ACTN|nr:tetratricopeptide (TPR) repeat protein [Kineococcus aurantiacus]
MDEDLEARLRAALADTGTDPGIDTDELVGLGCDLADAGHQRQALTCFQRAVALGSQWVWFNVGNTLRELQRPTEAVEAYHQAIAAGETDAWLNLGHVLEGLGDLAGAMDAYRGAAVRGEQPEGYVQLAHLLHEQGEPEQAGAALARAVESGYLPAVALAARWRWERTRDTTDPVLEEQLRAGAGVDGSARADLAALLLARGRRSEALEQLQLGAKLGQRECWLPLGNLLAGDDLAGADPPGGPGGLGDHEPAAGGSELVDEVAAEEAYRAGIAAGDAWCHHNLALLLLERGDVRGAEAHLLAGAAAGDELAQQAWQDLHRED